MCLELLRQWAHVETWGNVRRVRDRALHVVLSHDITLPEPEEETARFAEAIDESRFYTRRLKDLEDEHREIVLFLEEAAPDLLGAVPLIPEEGPTPEDAANRAQAMAGALGAFLMRNRPTIATGSTPEQSGGKPIGPLSVAEWSIAIGCGETKTRDLFEQWGIEKLHGGYSVPHSLLTEQQRTKAQELFEKRQTAAQSSIQIRRMTTKLKRAKH